MSTYSNRLQPALLNLLQHVVRFFHQRSSCPTHISADICGGRKSLVKPVTRQNILSCSVLSPEIVMHDDAYICGRSENNIKCIMHDDLVWKNRTTRYILPRHWLYEWFSQFRRCGTYSVLSRSHSINVHRPYHQSRRRRVPVALITAADGVCHPTSAALIISRQSQRSIYPDRSWRRCCSQHRCGASGGSRIFERGKCRMHEDRGYGEGKGSPSPEFFC